MVRSLRLCRSRCWHWHGEDARVVIYVDPYWTDFHVLALAEHPPLGADLLKPNAGARNRYVIFGTPDRVPARCHEYKIISRYKLRCCPHPAEPHNVNFSRIMLIRSCEIRVEAIAEPLLADLLFVLWSAFIHSRGFVNDIADAFLKPPARMHRAGAVRATDHKPSIILLVSGLISRTLQQNDVCWESCRYYRRRDWLWSWHS